MEFREVLSRSDTAFYVFDSAVLQERIRTLRGLLPENVGICYAVKANTFIIGAAEPWVDRLEVCSPGEARVCESLGVPGEKMVISGVYKTTAFIAERMADPGFNGIFTAESLQQYEMLCYDGKKFGKRVPVLLRVTNDSQFGMDEAVIEGIIRDRAAHPEIDILGLQYFSGTQKTSLKKLGREIGHLDAFLVRIREEWGFEARELEYGTGFPVAYFESDQIDEGALIGGFAELIDGMCCKPKLTIELGRSIAASCGTYYTHVVDIKQNRGQNYLLVDGGMHQIVYYGQQMAMKRPGLHVVGKEEDPVDEAWNICGPCAP